MLVTVIEDVVSAFPLFLVFAIFLFLFVFKATGKFNIFLLVFLSMTMLSEMTFLYDTNRYMSITTVLSVIACASLLFLIKPVIKKRTKAFSKHNLIELIIGFVGVGSVMGYLVYAVIPLVPNISVFIVSLITSTATIMVCFILPNYNKHTDNVALFFIGGSYMAELAFAFIYAYINKELAFLIISIFMGSFLKIVLCSYLIKISRVTDADDLDFLE